MRQWINLFESPVEDMFRRYDGKVMTYAELPEAAQKALHHYLAVECDSPDFANGSKFGYVLVPTQSLKDAIWNSDFHQADGVGSYGDFDGYHKWYWSAETSSNYENHLKEMWPVILDSDEIILDGWHRFHYYVNQGVEMIPAVVFV